MNQDKIHLINKLFNNETIRTIWDCEKEKYYISVIDVARRGGKIAHNAKKDLENELGESVVTSKNTLNYKYMN